MVTAAAPLPTNPPAVSQSPATPTASVDQPALEVLARVDAPMVEVMKAMATLDRSPNAWRAQRLGIAANITIDLLDLYLRRHAYLCGVRLEVIKGHYDDLLGDTQAHVAAGVDLLLVLPFFDNLQPSWEARLNVLSVTERQAPMQDWLARLELALQSSRRLPQVLVLGAHLWHSDVPADSPQNQALSEFNAGLRDTVDRHANARMLDTMGLLATLGARQALDARFYFRAKAPYTARFIDALAQRVASSTRGFGGQFHKVLVLDCDNTLWGGIVGEDGLNGIQLNPNDHPGNIFWTVQHQLQALERQGVLLCLCSKNNPADVEEVLEQHQHMVLRGIHLVARRVAWTDKPSSLRALASELNLGLESFVFVDDSAFEIEAVRAQLPQVRAFLVPKSLQDYPALMHEVAALFVHGAQDAQGLSKTLQYRHLAEASRLRAGFKCQEDYLRSLQLVVRTRRNDATQVTRIAELTNKSNQFNLTTQRLEVGDVVRLMESPNAMVYAFSVADRLTDHGLTGVLVTQDVGDAVTVHSFLMSCRIIGRGVEFAVWKALLSDAQARGLNRLKAAYRPTAKNSQVADFYDRLGLRLVDTSGGDRHYEIQLADAQLAESDWVELRND